MAHPRLEEIWLDLAEGTLPDAEARAVRAHLDGCEACAARYRTLSAVHRLSRTAGRLAAAEPPPVPATLDARVLAGAREAAAVPRRSRVTRVAFAAAAIAALALLSLRIVVPMVRERRDAAALRGALAALAAPPGLRGRDPLDAAVARVSEEWRAGRLHLERSEARCPGGTLRVSALLDAGGTVALLAERTADRVDLHLYDPGGAPAASARVVGGARSDYALAPRSQGDAAAALATPLCARASR